MKFKKKTKLTIFDFNDGLSNGTTYLNDNNPDSPVVL